MLFILVLAAVTGCGEEGPTSPATPTDADAQANLAGLRDALARGEWLAVVRKGETLRASLPRGGTEWFEASAHLAQAHYQIWQPDLVDRIARDVLDLTLELQKREPGSRRSALGPLDPVTAGLVLDTEIRLARVLQSRGDHSGACEHLQPIVRALSRSQADTPSLPMRNACLDLGLSMLAMGRTAAARQAFDTARRLFPGSLEQAKATVMLEQTEAGLVSYRGKYDGDPGHVRRMRQVAKTLPHARRRLADVLGLDVRALPFVAVGVADRPEGVAVNGALTTGDPRRRCHPPISILFSEALSLEIFDVETLLVHEISHGALLTWVGPAYERLPPWVTEGMAHLVAGEVDVIFQDVLVGRFYQDPDDFLGVGGAKCLAPRFLAPPSSETPTAEAGLALFALGSLAGKGAGLRFIRELVRVKNLDRALESVCGLDSASFLTAATPIVQARLGSLREECLESLRRLHAAWKSGPDDVMAATTAEALTGLPEIAREYGLLIRAQSLEFRGDLSTALTAWNTLLAERRFRQHLVEKAAMARARCLAGLGRKDEALRVMRRLRRDALQESVRAWAHERLLELRAWSDR